MKNGNKEGITCPTQSVKPFLLADKLDFENITRNIKNSVNIIVRKCFLKLFII